MLHLQLLELDMNVILTSIANEMHTVVLAAERLCADYWVGFNAINQDPKLVASFYKESGT